MKVRIAELAGCFGIGQPEKAGYMQYNDMISVLVFYGGLSETEARRSITEDLFRGLLRRTEKGYQVNRGYRIEVGKSR